MSGAADPTPHAESEPHVVSMANKKRGITDTIHSQTPFPKILQNHEIHPHSHPAPPTIIIILQLLSLSRTQVQVQV